MEAPSVIPTDITVERSRRMMTIVWADESQSEIDFATLRAGCPCAECRHLHEAVKPELPKPEDFVDIAMDKIEEVGNYALRITWSDGHSTGIYSFEYLRRLSTTEKA